MSQAAGPSEGREGAPGSSTAGATGSKVPSGRPGGREPSDGTVDDDGGLVDGAPAAEGSDRPTVLFVDDERALVDAYARWLEDRCDVRRAYSERSGLARLDGVDVVFLDRKMPGRSGPEVHAAIRERGHRCPVVLLSAFEPDAETADLDVDGYLQKPVDREELLATVEGLIGEDGRA